MPTIQCSGKTNGKACLESFTTQEAVHKHVKFTCRLHTEKGPNEERFQESQFDRKLSNKKSAH
jgi:hypothetical protein